MSDKLQNYLNLIHKDYSIILPSRGRTKYLRDLFTSILNNTEKLSRVEVIVAFDSDELVDSALMIFHEFPQIDTKVIIRKRDDDISNQYFNLMARAACGDYIWGINDDCEIRTKNWDTILDKKISEIPYKIFCLKTYGPGVNFKDCLCGFPIVPKIVTDGFGYFIHPGIFGHRVDHYFSSLWHGTGRWIDTPEIYLWHYNNSPGGCDDDTQKSMRKTYDKSVIDAHSFPFFPQEQEKIKQLIKKYEGA